MVDSQLTQDVHTASQQKPAASDTLHKQKASKLKRGLVILTTVCISLVVGLILGEIVLRLCGFSDFKGIAYVMPDKDLSHVNKPGTEVDVRGSDFHYKVRINSLGFRGNELRTDDRFRILLIGDSFTFGQGVDDDQTFAANLQTYLDDAGRDDVQVINAGVYAYGALQAKGLAMRLWEVTSPDVVIYTHCGNDFADDLRHADGRYVSLRNSIPGRRFLRENSVLYNVAKPAALSVLSAVGVYDMQLRFESADQGSLVSDLDNLWQKGRDTTCRALGDLHRTCNECGAKFVVTSVGFSATENGVQFSSDTDAVKTFCEQNGIPFLDPRIAFPAKESEPWHNQNSVGHFTPQANQYFAESLFTQLAQRELLPETAASVPAGSTGGG